MRKKIVAILLLSSCAGGLCFSGLSRAYVGGFSGYSVAAQPEPSAYSDTEYADVSSYALFSGAAEAAVSADAGKLQPIDYTESLATVARQVQPLNGLYAFAEQDALCRNPERGFYSSSKLFLTEDCNIEIRDGGVAYVVGEGKAPSFVETKSGASSLLQLGVDLGAFSGSINGTGADKELTAAAIKAIDDTLGIIKQNDNTVMLRFVYGLDATGEVRNPYTGAVVPKVEPAQAMLLRHIEQLGPTLRKYASTINVIQMGFYGLWGEAYYNTDAASRPDLYRQTVRKLLDVTDGTDIRIAVRTPQYYSWFRNADIGKLSSDITTSADDAYRVCVFNDGYGGSSTDLGTFSDRNAETDWLKNQASHGHYGGEAVVDGTSGGVGAYNEPGFFIKEAFKVHTSYLNWEWNQNLHKGWAERNYTGGDTLYSGRKALTYIENHLGYRLVLRESRLPETVAVGGALPVNISVENVGFGNVVRNKRADIVITNASGGVVAERTGVSIDARAFTSQATVRQTATVSLSGIGAGTYKAYLRISSGETLDNGRRYSAIRFANGGVWDDTLQANYIGSFTVA